jgi:hypothetical protein
MPEGSDKKIPLKPPLIKGKIPFRLLPFSMGRERGSGAAFFPGL